MSEPDHQSGVRYAANPAMFRNNPFGFILAVLLCVAGIGFVILLYWYLKTKATHFEIGDREIALTEGLLSKERTELSLASVRTVKVRQSFFQRLFGVGNVMIYSAGDKPEIEVHGLPDPNQIHELIGR